MDEHLTNIIETAILDYQNDGNKAREQHLMECFVSKAVTAAGYRLDPYPNGKTKGQLIARIEELEAERDKARVLLYNVRNINQVPGSVAREIDGFLTKTSLVHG